MYRCHLHSLAQGHHQMEEHHPSHLQNKMCETWIATANHWAEVEKQQGVMLAQHHDQKIEPNWFQKGVKGHCHPMLALLYLVQHLWNSMVPTVSQLLALVSSTSSQLFPSQPDELIAQTNHPIPHPREAAFAPPNPPHHAITESIA
nr:unnamed protein product [Digitaria exilis]